MAVDRRNSHLELEAEEEGLRRQISAEVQAVAEQAAEQAAEVITPSPKAVPMISKAPHDLVNCDFDLVSMAEAEEHSLAIDRRQISINEAVAIGGRRRLHGEQPEQPAAVRGLETPQNNHHLAGQAEAEEMGWALDRQVSAQGPAEGPTVRRVSENAEREPESPKAALERRCSHDLAASAEAEEVGWALDRQVSAQEAVRGA